MMTPAETRTHTHTHEKVNMMTEMMATKAQTEPANTRQNKSEPTYTRREIEGLLSQAEQVGGPQL